MTRKIYIILRGRRSKLPEVDGYVEALEELGENVSVITSDTYETLRYFKRLKFYLNVNRELTSNNSVSIVWVIWQPMSFILPLLNKISLKKLGKFQFVMDVRTKADSNGLKAQLKDILTKFEACFFDKIVLINKNISFLVGQRKFFELPMGVSRDFLEGPKYEYAENLRISYFGTINKDRGIDIGLNLLADLPIVDSITVASFNSFSMTASRVPFTHLGVIERAYVPDSLRDNNINACVSLIAPTSAVFIQEPTKVIEALALGYACVVNETPGLYNLNIDHSKRAPLDEIYPAIKCHPTWHKLDKFFGEIYLYYPHDLKHLTWTSHFKGLMGKIL